ncbi:hypothetical protein D3C75_852660 [compost metagenome]
MIGSYHQQIILKSKRILHHHTCSRLHIALALMGNMAVLSQRLQAVLYFKRDLINGFLNIGLDLVGQPKRFSHRIAVLNILLFTVRLEDTECNIFFAFLGR